MTKSKKLSMFIFSLLLVVASLLFVACTTSDYKNVTITASHESVELFISDSEEENSQLVTFTINNPPSGMETGLVLLPSDDGVYTASLVSTAGYSSTYSLTGISGGVSTLTVRTREGNVSHTINVVVRQYPSDLTAGDNSLYLSLSSLLAPSSADFNFSDNSTERDLTYYFYGIANEPISLADIEQGSLTFVSARLIERNGNQYIIFEDGQGQLYTLGEGQDVAGSTNIKYSFIDVEMVDGEYDFATNSASTVTAGEKFTFLAVNEIQNGESLYCQRDFYVITDINAQSITHDYGYKIDGYDYTIGSDYLYKLENSVESEITLIPSYKSVIEDGFFVGNQVDYITAYLEVSIAGEGDLLKVRASSRDRNIINSIGLGKLTDNGITTYYYQIDCATNIGHSTVFDLNFYYDGFENSEDSNVNFTYSIPVNIRIIPTNILVNDIDLSSSEQVFTFYDSYAGDSFGWQQFVFSLNPEDAEYDNVVIDLTNTDLRLRYNNNYYQDQVVVIDDISEPIYLKGASGAEVTDEVQSLPIQLNFNVLEENSITAYLLYEIVKGATVLDFSTDEYRDRIYLDINGGEVAFTDLYANAHFEDIEVERQSGFDVARFIIGEELYTQQGGYYYLNLSIRPIAVGSGVYSVILDNGKQISVTITVEESLSSVSISSQNVQNSIRYTEEVVDDGRSSTMLYVYNSLDDTYFDVEVVANGDDNSNAINNIQFSFTSQLIRIGEVTNNNKNFNVHLQGNGSATLQLAVSGYSINNFRRENIALLYYIDIISFNYINNLNVYKTHDGRGDYTSETNTDGVNAAYADVYSGTNNSRARSVVFNVDIGNTDAFLFADPSSIELGDIQFLQTNFNQDYIYWETDWSYGITKDGTPVDIMYYDDGGSNIYSLTGVGTFDTSTMTFTALSSLENPRDFRLIAHVRQYGRVYSYTVNVRISIYEQVSRITLQETDVTSLEFTSTERTQSVIAYPTNSTATNGEIVAFFEAGEYGSITVSNEDGTTSTYYMLDENSIDYVVSGDRYQIILTVNEDYARYALDYQGRMEGSLVIVASDWLDENGNILSTYENLVIRLPLYFANGTEQNRFTLKNVDDILDMNLSAHYQISTSIDVSSISDMFPLGSLTGSIVGTGEYAEITGINITNSQIGQNQGSQCYYYGMFSTISQGAYIEYVSFSGEINVGSQEEFAPLNSYIGLVAGQNDGELTNIGVTLEGSQVYITSGFVGGIVGYNNGTILQDYTLFEDNSSLTRTVSSSQLSASGRYSYAGMNPNILVYMNGAMTVNHLSYVRAGGVSGYNNGTIRKIDSQVLTFVGYSNYMAYSLIDANPISSMNLTPTSYVGGLVGETSVNSTIDSGYNLYDGVVTFTKYRNYVGSSTENRDNDYTVGQGIVVGGQVSGYDYVGGVVGYIELVGNGGMAVDNFTGITSRVYVRGYLASLSPTAQVAIIANIANVSVLNTAFAIQAVDSGNSGINASMMIVYNSTNISGYYYSEDHIANSNKLAFGRLVGNNVDIMSGVEGEDALASVEQKSYINVYTYAISRSKIEMDEQEWTSGDGKEITTFNRTSYYGDFIVVGDDGDTLHGQAFFTEGSEEFLSINAKFNNKFVAENSGDYQGRENIYYMFYFQVGESFGESNQGYQDLLDTYLNVVEFNSIIYPITTNGEMIFTSNNRDILTIDQNGRINVKGTGLVRVTASSVLNTNNALEFYIYVVNYFNPDEPIFSQSESDNYQKNSIIYPNTSANSSPINDVTINMRGNNSTTFYVRPFYSLSLAVLDNSGEERAFISDASGLVTFNNVVFYLAQNTTVTAEITNVIRYDGEEQIDVTDENELSIDISGQNIIIRRNGENTKEADYKLTIVPKLVLYVNETDGYNQISVKYSSSVNKTLDNVTINYRKGAISINNTKFNDATLISSKKIEDIIVINSTAEELQPYYYIVGPDNQLLQGSGELALLFNYNYQLTGENELFDVSFEPNLDNIDNLSGQRFNLTISVNKYSDMYTNRYNENIYGDYTVYIYAQSNTSLFTVLTIHFEQTNILSVSVDNYTNLAETTGTAGLSTTSENAVPGVTGLLAITVSPDDSDFDYILIENAQSNYDSGNATATFGLVARNLTTSGEDNDIFDDSTIVGSSTDSGVRFNLDDIINVYNRTVDGERQYYNYNGVIYIKYDLGSYNVVDGSTTSFVISLVKDGQRFEVTKQLTVELQNFVAVEIADKEPTAPLNSGGYYAQYNVARGLRYRLNINSYGYATSSISVPTVDNVELATIVEENGVYYLEITSNAIDYSNGNNSFDISISASQMEGEVQRRSYSTTHIVISEYVVNYDPTSNVNEDIVTGMGNGEINIQVGTQYTLAVDILDYIEYDPSINSVVSNLNLLMDDLARQGSWVAHTNLLTDTQPDYGIADDSGLPYTIGYDSIGNAREVSNYYFTSNGLNILPRRTHVPQDRYYYFTYNSFIEYNQLNGTYYVTNQGSLSISTEFVLNVYSSSSEESPIPIYDYDDLMSMQSGGYYILLNDITLPNTANSETGEPAFSPITTNIASFDGNGHTINFAGTYDMGSNTSIGIFTSLSEGAIIRNLNVNFTSASDGSDVNVEPNDDYGWYGLRTVKFVTSADTFNFGAIVAENNGIITNCNVTTDEVNGSEYYVVVKADNALNGTSYMAGITAINSGYITNCSVSINMKSPYSMGGIAGQNSNKISATYFKGGKLINNSQQNQHVAGFVVRNLDNGQIITSYVAGQPSRTSIYSKDTNSYISSSISAAGFVYQNTGTISDCYTDILLSQTTSDMAGFVYQNGGVVRNCFSLSVLRNNVTASAGFARYDSYDNAQGTFENCYYFYNNNTESVTSGDYTNEEGFIYGEGNINTSVIPITYSGIERLNAGGFANLENFSSYSYQDTMSINGVWFFSSGNTSTTFVDYIPTTEKIEISVDDEEQSQNVQTNTVYTTQLSEFGFGRLELVSPNVDTLSIRNFSYSETDDSTGDVIYHYVDDSTAPNRGSLHNPRLLYTAENMESEIGEQTSLSGLNTTYYRIICDINYSNYDALSNIYQTTYAGVLEGNGMEISRISLVSMDSLTNAGLFAQIGYSSSRTGAIKNLTITPEQVAFTNTNSVGTLAGTLRYGYLYDITIDNGENSGGVSSDLVVVGRNFVGGVVGRAVGYYEMKNITSNVNTSSTYASSSPVSIYNENSNNMTDYSYSGSIAGFLGTGYAYNINADQVGSVVGSRAGFAFGGIGNGANVEYLYVNVMAGSRIRAYHYGGYAIGEIVGSLDHVQVYGEGGIESTFSVVPRSANAVGGIAGVLSGGSITNAVMEQSFRATAISATNTVINSVGGIVGLVANAGSVVSQIKNSIVDVQLIEGSSIVGGAVGQMSNALNIDGMAVKAETVSVTGEKADPYIGGVVGYVTSENNTMLNMINSYSTCDITINTNTSGIASTASAGGLVGYASRTPMLAYCYTTSSVNAEIQDLRSLDSVADFADVYVASGETSETNINYANFNYSIIDNINGNRYNNVYYLGHDSVTDSGNMEEAYALSRNYNISFRTKVRSSTIGLTINNYGTSSLSYALSSSSSTQESIYYNLFNSTYLTPSGSMNDSTSPAKLVYDSVNNSYVLDGLVSLGYTTGSTYVNTSDITNYITTETTVNGTSIVGQPSTSTRQILYISEDDQTKYTYYSAGGSNGVFVSESNALSGRVNSTDSGNLETLSGNITIKTTTILPSYQGLTIQLRLNNNSYAYEQYNGIYMFTNSSGNLLDLVDNSGNVATMTISLNLDGNDRLLKETLFTDGENHYMHTYVYDEDDVQEPFKEAYVNIVTGQVHYAEDFTAPTSLVWNTSEESLSTLMFEDDLDWLK